MRQWVIDWAKYQKEIFQLLERKIGKITAYSSIILMMVLVLSPELYSIIGHLVSKINEEAKNYLSTYYNYINLGALLMYLSLSSLGSMIWSKDQDNIRKLLHPTILVSLDKQLAVNKSVYWKIILENISLENIDRSFIVVRKISEWSGNSWEPIGEKNMDFKLVKTHYRDVSEQDIAGNSSISFDFLRMYNSKSINQSTANTNIQALKPFVYDKSEGLSYNTSEINDKVYDEGNSLSKNDKVEITISEPNEIRNIIDINKKYMIDIEINSYDKTPKINKKYILEKETLYDFNETHNPI